MKPFMRSFCALALVLVCLPMLADDCPAIQSLTATDTQTGGPVLIQWSYSGGQPSSQTITGHDFEDPVVLAPGQTQYVYRAGTPGEKHLQLSAVTACGTVTQTVKYHVKQCNVVAPPLTVSATRIDAGATFTASVDLEPGHTVLWEIVNGTPSSMTSPSITITAGNAGFVTVRAWVSRGNSCSVRVSKSVRIEPACAIAEPVIYAWPEIPLPDSYFSLNVELPPGQEVTYAVRGAEVMFMWGPYLDLMTPSNGSFEVDVIVSNGTCSRTFTRVFEVTPCAATATITPGTSDPACGVTSVVVDLTGTGPWYGTWSDGEWFYSETAHYERQIVNPGTYTLAWVSDWRCQGTVTGSVDANPGAAPEFTIEPLVNGEFFGELLCPGTPRTAQLTSAMPADAQIVWSIDNGTILGGQGTPQVQFSGTAEGPTALTVTVTGTNVCGRPATKYLETLGVPHPTVSVEPSTIPAGGTAIVTLNMGGYFVGSYRVTSSLGDPITWNANGQLEYRSTHGGGVATITLEAENICGVEGTATTTLTIDGGNPVTATANVFNYGNSCENYSVHATLTGTAPFSGTWSDGRTFTTNETYTYFEPTQPGTYTIVEFRDANGPGTVTGSVTLDFVALPEPDFVFSSSPACPSSTITATLTTPVPAGVTPKWMAFGANIISGQGTPSVELQVTGTYVVATVELSGGNACSPTASKSNQVVSATPQAPNFSPYPVESGSFIEFQVYLDPNMATWGFENSLGDPMEIRYEYNSHTFLVRYTSTSGPGTSNIRIYGTTTCGATFESTKPIEILPPPPPAPTVEMTSVQGETCGATITLTFTGTPPFTGTWADNGETFTTNEYTHTRFVTQSRHYFLSYFSDANRTGGSSYTYVEAKYLPYAGVSGVSDICVDQPMTYEGPEVPAGWELIWTIEGSNAVIVSGQGTRQVVVKATAPGTFELWNRFRAPEGCEGSGSGGIITANACSTP